MVALDASRPAPDEPPQPGVPTMDLLESSAIPLVGQLRKRRQPTKDDYLKVFGLIAIVSGTVAGWLVFPALGLAVLSLLSILFALAVLRFGEDEP